MWREVEPMQLFTKRTPMNKLETDIAKMTTRRSLLNGKRDAARSALNDANAAQQKFMLEGDIENVESAKRLQAAIDTATSELAGFDTAIGTLDASIIEAEQALSAEERKAKAIADAQAVSAIAASIEAKVEPWLTATRAIATDLENLHGFCYTPAPLAAFFRRVASEAEFALRATLTDLNQAIPQVSAGTMKGIIVPGAQPTRKAIVELPTTRLFTTKNVSWTDDAGDLKTAGKFNAVDLPVETAKRALASDACREIGSELWKAWGNTRPISNPPVAECEDLDAASAATVTTTVQSDPIFTPMDRGPPVTMSISREAS
jgi:hypothetical protein